MVGFRSATSGSDAKHPTKASSFTCLHLNSCQQISFPTLTTMANPQFLSGDKTAIDEFLDKFDVRMYPYNSEIALTSC
jgi:phosphoribulokinase